MRLALLFLLSAAAMAVAGPIAEENEDTDGLIQVIEDDGDVCALMLWLWLQLRLVCKLCMKGYFQVLINTSLILQPIASCFMVY